MADETSKLSFVHARALNLIVGASPLWGTGWVCEHFTLRYDAIELQLHFRCDGRTSGR